MKSFGKKTALDEVSLEDKVTVQSPIIVNEKNNAG